jgi:hypothetical protein
VPRVVSIRRIGSAADDWEPHYSGTRCGMVAEEPACIFAPCPRPAGVPLRLLVEGQESEVTVCQCHADWLHHYVEGDAAVQLLSKLAEASARPSTGT